VVWVKKKNEPDDHLLIAFFFAVRRPEMPGASVVWPMVFPMACGSELPSIGEFHLPEQKKAG